MRRGWWSRSWVVMLTWSGLAGAVTGPRAEPSVERGYSLEYRAASECPDAPALTQAIEARTPGATQRGRDAMVRLRVELREDGTSTLWVDLPEGRSRRDFPSAACADALASIAVIASMVLEADASERLSAVQEVMDPLTSDAPTPEPMVSAAAPETTLAPARPAEAVEALPPPGQAQTPEPKRARLRIGIAAGLLLESAVAKNGAWGAEAGVGAWLQPRRPSVWVPGIRVQALATLPVTVRATQGDLELRLLAGRLHLCPLLLPVGQSLRIVPCLTGDIGVLRARGTGPTVNPLEPTMPWAALGGTLRAQLALGSVVALESWLGLRGLARADTFVFSQPDLVGYVVPRWSMGAGLGLSLVLR